MQRHSPLLSRPAVRTLLPLALAAAAALAGCTLRPPLSGEEQQVDSVALSPDLAQGVVAQPFCLHLRYHNRFFVAYSDDRAEAWVTDGRCGDTDGAKRPVESVRISWSYDWTDAQNNRQCVNTDACRMNEQGVIAGRNIRCATAQARDGNQTAFITTDHVRCH